MLFNEKVSRIVLMVIMFLFPIAQITYGGYIKSLSLMLLGILWLCSGFPAVMIAHGMLHKKIANVLGIDRHSLYDMMDEYDRRKDYV